MGLTIDGGCRKISYSRFKAIKKRVIEMRVFELDGFVKEGTI